MALSELDYLEQNLFKDGSPVDAVRMLGKAVEAYNDLCKSIGVNSVTAGRMPENVELDLDRRGRRKVLFHAPEREAGVSIGSELRLQIHSHGYGVLLPNVPVVSVCPKTKQKKKVGEHDLTLEIVKQNSSTVAGRISCEIKVRSVTGPKHRRWLIDHLKKTTWLGSEKHAWWENESQKPDWAGRMLILVELPSTAETMQSFTLWPFVRLLGGHWTDGWRGRHSPCITCNLCNSKHLRN